MSVQPTEHEAPLVINIAGATAKNYAEAENTAANINILQDGTGQSIDINQKSEAIVNNTTIIIIGTPYPVSYRLNENDKTLNVEILESGEVKLNGEAMDIKALKNGMKVMFLHDKGRDTITNDRKEKNIND